MRFLLVLTLALFVFSGVGCSDESNPVEIEPSFEATPSAPSESGIVTRDAILWGTTIVDFGSGLRSVIGIPASEFCVGSGDFAVMDLMTASLNTGNEIVQIRGEAYAEVWPVGPFDCDVYTTTEPIASGTVSVVRSDNDWNLDGGRMNAYGWRAQGTLYGPDGTAYRFSEVVSLQWPDGSPTNVVRNIKVQLTRTGR